MSIIMKEKTRKTDTKVWCSTCGSSCFIEFEEILTHVTEPRLPASIKGYNCPVCGTVNTSFNLSRWKI